MGRKSLRIGNVNAASTEGLLEVPHDIQMADKFHDTVFTEFNPYLYHNVNLTLTLSSFTLSISCKTLNIFFNALPYIPLF